MTPAPRSRAARAKAAATTTEGTARATTDLAAVTAAVAGIPFMSPHQGRVVYEHVRATRPREVLELGTAHGVGTAYLAAGLEPGAHVTTVDFAGACYDPPPEVVLERAGVADRVEVVRRYSSYTWWLKEEVQARSDAA